MITTLRLRFGLREMELFWASELAEDQDGYVVEMILEHIAKQLDTKCIGSENYQKIADTLNDQGWSKMSGFHCVANELFHLGSRLDFRVIEEGWNINFEKIMALFIFASVYSNIPQNVFGMVKYPEQEPTEALREKCEKKIKEMSEIVADYFIRYLSGWLWKEQYFYGLLANGDECLKRASNNTPYDLRNDLLDKNLPAILKSLSSPIRFIYD